MNTENKKVNLLLVFEILALIVVLVFAIVINISKASEGTPSTEPSQSEVVGSEDTEGSSETEKLPEDEEDTEKRMTFSATVEAKLASMTNAEKVAQLFVVTPEQLTGVDRVTIFGDTSKSLLDEYPIGGMVYASLNYAADEQFHSLVKGAKDYYKFKYDLSMFALVAEADKDTLASKAEIDADVDLVMLSDDSKEAIQSARKAMSNYHIFVLNGTSKDAEGCLKAFEAGADMIYMPADFKGAYEAILKAVNDGIINLDRLNNAVGRILTEKGV